MDPNRAGIADDWPNEAPSWRRRSVWWSAYFVLWTIGLLMPMAPGTVQETGLLFILAKILHVVAYAGLAILSGWLRLPCRWRWVILFIIMAHAPVTELLQLNIEGRTGTLRDVGLDHLGIGLGLLLTWKWWAEQP